MKVVLAFDDFKGSIDATTLVSQAARAFPPGVQVVRVPLSDGGDGFVDLLAERTEQVSVIDALGGRAEARIGWRGPDAIVQVADAAGLARIGGARANDAVRASSRGVGELISQALARAPRRLLVGCGGSATSDGGLGLALELERQGHAPLEVATEVAVDVGAPYLQAARVFGPQKGASDRAAQLLSIRLEGVRTFLRRSFGVDPEPLWGGGAAGGIAGALAALGGHIVPGFVVVARVLEFERALEGADLVCTGEGCLDETSFLGKVVDRVETMARAKHVPRVVAVVGQATEGGRARAASRGIEVLELAALAGLEAAKSRPGELVTEVLRAMAAH
jgi:glycerate kinase